MKVKISHLCLGALLPGFALFLGIMSIHRVFKIPSIQNREKISSLSEGSSSNLLVAVTPEELVAEAEHLTASPSTHQETAVSDKWRMFDPNSMKEDDRIWMNTEVLFFQSHMGSLAYGTESSSTSSIQHGEVKSPHFNWNTGYRLGIGYKIPHDKWDLFANYTYLYGSAEGSSESGSKVIFPLWASNFGGTDPFYAASAKAHWNMHLNMGDVELGRNCFVGKWFTIRPFMGVRGGTINQQYHVKYQGGTVAPSDTDKLHLNTDFWGVGVRMGFNSLWGFGKGFSLYGNGSASLLSGHFDVHEREKLINAEFQKMNIESNVNNVVVDADVSLGLQWDYMFSRDRYHFGVKMGWEFDLFFNQNQLFNFAGTNPGAIRFQNDDLAFQGVTLGFRFDF